VVRADNEQMGYCFRYGKTYFVNRFTGKVNIADGNSKGMELSFFESGRINQFGGGSKVT
jgi:hypothetical protein